MKRKQIIALSGALCAGMSFAGTFTWKSADERLNDWNWCEGANFVGGSAPSGTGSIVVIPDNTKVLLKAGDADSRAKVNSLSLVSTDGENAMLEVEVAETETEPFVLTPQVRYGGPDGSKSVTGAGHLVKTGGGSLVLSDNDAHAYHLNYEIKAGTLKMSPTAKSQGNYYVSSLAVSNGATFFYAPNTAWTRCGWVFGTGTIRTDTAGSPFCMIGGTVQDPNVVEAYLAGGTSAWVGGYVRLACPSNANGSCYVYNNAARSAESGGSVAEFSAFGESGSPSYLGAIDYLQPSTMGGFFRYVGTEDATCGYKVSVGYPAEGPAGFDAGPHGGVAFANNWSYSGTGVACAFYLCGSNTVPCVVAGNVVSEDFSFVKTGSGTWRFADGATRSNHGGFAVDEGTLQFDSIAEVGESCSLGLATMLYPRGYYGATASATPVDYAFTLGYEGKTGTLEYTGSKAIHNKTRSIALLGDGRLVDSVKEASTNPHLHVGVHAGVKSIAEGFHRLVLDGTNANGDEISGVTDGATGRVGLVKRGSGVWRVCGDSSFTGPIEVEEGTLKLAGPHYTWYRMTLTATISRDVGSTSNELQMDELGLFDKDGIRQNLGIERVEDRVIDTTSSLKFGAFLLPGECAYADTTFVANTKYGTIYYGHDGNDAERLFDGSAGNEIVRMNYMYPNYAGATQWYGDIPWVLTFRLPESAKPVTSYDIVTFRPGPDDPGNYAKNPKTWKLEGSVNGKDWVVLHEMANAASDDPDQILKIAGAHKWMSGTRSTFTSADGVTVPHTTGQPIAAAPANAPTLYQGIDYVSVADGATLVAEGDITLDGIKVDYGKGAGTMTGFTFADEGTFTVENIPLDEAAVTLPGTYDRKIAGWTLASSNPRIARREMSMDKDGHIKLFKRGLSVIIR